MKNERANQRLIGNEPIIYGKILLGNACFPIEMVKATSRWLTRLKSIRIAPSVAELMIQKIGHCDIVIEACNQMLWLGKLP